MATTRSAKATRVVEAGLDILRDEGDRALTMRGVANRLGMSLSNVQYYFPDKDSLLCEMVAHYMKACGDEFDRLTDRIEAKSLRERRRALLMAMLAHGHEMTEMCRIFREVWAISGRSERVADTLRAYYARFTKLLTGSLLAPGTDSDIHRRLALLLLPYVEGYSIVGDAVGQDQTEAVELLLQLMEGLDEA
ncbi:MAG: TetR/AcrR family transcriptional regulator [Myxococcota bacterium]